MHVKHLQWYLAHSRQSLNLSYFGAQFEINDVKNPVVSSI